MVIELDGAVTRAGVHRYCIDRVVGRGHAGDGGSAYGGVGRVERKVLCVYSENRLAERHGEVDVVQVRCTWQGRNARRRHHNRADGREDDLVGDNRGGPRRGRLVICPSGRILASGVND